MPALVSPLLQPLAPSVFNQRSGGGASSGPAWLTGVTVLGDFTVNNTVHGAGSVLVQANGWMLRVATTLGAVTSCDPTKVTIALQDYGWNADGTPATRTRVARGRKRLAKPYPDGAAFTDADQAAGTVEFSLDHQLYNVGVVDSSARFYRTEITSIVFGANFINASAAGTLTGSGLITRADSKLYPVPLWKQIDHPDFLADQTTFPFEWNVVHQHAQFGQQIACLEAWARAGGVDGAIARAGSMTESRWTSDGTVPRGAPAAMHAPVYSTTISVAGLADGPASIRSRAKPWIGPEVNSYDLGIGDAAPTFNLHADLPFVIDLTTGKYTWVDLWVAPDGVLGSGSIAGVQTPARGARSSDPGAALSYTSIPAALSAGQTYNNSTSGRGSGKTHNDTDGVRIRLKPQVGSVAGADAGAYNHMVALNTIVNISNLMYPVIEAANGVRSDEVRVRGVGPAGETVTLANKQTLLKTKWVNVKFDCVGVSSGATNNGAVIRVLTGSGLSTPPTQVNNPSVVLENCDMLGNGTEACIAGPMVLYNYRTTWYNTNNTPPVSFTRWSGQAVNCGSALLAGGVDQAHNIASYSERSGPAGQAAVSLNPSIPTVKQPLLVNSRFDFNDINGLSFWGAGGHPQRALGFGMSGVLFRCYGPVNKQAMLFSGDDNRQGFENVVIQHTSTPATGDATGRRWNVGYNDIGWVAVEKEITFLFNAFTRTANKADVFASTTLLNAMNAEGAHNSANAYYQGAIVYDATTGGGTLTTSNVYQALRDVPAATALTDASYWLSLGVLGNVASGSKGRRMGNRRFRMGVGSYGNVNGGSVQGTGSDTTPGYNNSWLSEAYFPGSGPDDSTNKWGNADHTQFFVDDDASTAAGVGNYRPNPAGPLVNMVPADRAVVPFDYLGTARLNDGTGAAGALERVA